MSDVEAGRRRVPWPFLLVQTGLIVVSILLAFALESWWEGRKEDLRRIELLEAVQSDFRATGDELANGLAIAERLVAQTQGFLDAVYGGALSVDSMRSLAQGFFRPITLQPTTPRYDAAILSGEIRLVRDDGVLAALAEYQEGLRWFERHDDVQTQIMFVGAFADLQRELGTTWVLAGEGPAALQPSDYMQVVRNPRVYGALGTMNGAQGNLAAALRRMGGAVASVLAELARALD